MPSVKNCIVYKIPWLAMKVKVAVTIEIGVQRTVDHAKKNKKKYLIKCLHTFEKKQDNANSLTMFVLLSNSVLDMVQLTKKLLKYFSDLLTPTRGCCQTSSFTFDLLTD